MKLISMTDFVLEQKEIAYKKDVWSNLASKLVLYAKFLKQRLTLGMFIPCDLYGNVLGEYNVVPDNGHSDSCNCFVCTSMYLKYDEYQKAKEKVLFEGFEISDFDLETNSGIYNCKKLGGCIGINTDIDELTIFNLTLTKSAIKQIGLTI